MNDHVSGEDLAAYVDGLLSTDKKNALESHFSCCPSCLDELVQIAGIMRGRGKIPTQFIKLALGEKNKPARPVLHLRLVFEIAAALVVVVFIGYLFLSNNRFWQAPEQQKTSVVSDRAVLPKGAAAAKEMAPQLTQQRDRTDVAKTKGKPGEADAGKGFIAPSIPAKRAIVNDAAGMPAAKAGSVQTAGQENKLQESTAEPEAFSGVQTDFAAKDRRAVKGKTEAVAETRQNLEKQKNTGAGAARPIALQEEKLQDETSQLGAAAAVLPTAKAAQSVLEDKKQGAALARKEIAGKDTLPPVRIEGDVAWTDLRNPELIFTWSWFRKDLILELRIDDTGTVTAVVPLGKTDPLLAKQAEKEAKKLLFSVSEKKLRRARLLANESPLN